MNWHSGLSLDPQENVNRPTYTATNSSKLRQYVGNKVYENGSLKRILLDNGYIEGGIYYFYLRDHLGNNSVVAKADGQVVQRNHYYPYGKVIGNGESWGQAAQPYKFGGKEEETMFGLELYDFHARQMDRRIPGFLTVDPLCEKYYSISPYAYCAGNPVNRIDPTGMDWVENEKTGNVTWRKEYTKDNVPDGYKYIGTEYNGLSITKFETTSYDTGSKDGGHYTSLNVEFSYRDPNSNEQTQYNWVQTVKRDDKEAFIDPYGNPKYNGKKDNFPFYQSIRENKEKSNISGYDITFSDNPDENANNGYFKAETSLIGYSSKGGILNSLMNVPEKRATSTVMTVQWGFSVKNGIANFNSIQIAKPSVFQQKAINSIYFLNK